MHQLFDKVDDPFFGLMPLKPTACDVPLKDLLQQAARVEALSVKKERPDLSPSEKSLYVFCEFFPRKSLFL